MLAHRVYTLRRVTMRKKKKRERNDDGDYEIFSRRSAIYRISRSRCKESKKERERELFHSFSRRTTMRSLLARKLDNSRTSDRQLGVQTRDALFFAPLTLPTPRPALHTRARVGELATRAYFYGRAKTVNDKLLPLEVLVVIRQSIATPRFPLLLKHINTTRVLIYRRYLYSSAVRVSFQISRSHNRI